MKSKQEVNERFQAAKAAADVGFSTGKICSGPLDIRRPTKLRITWRGERSGEFGEVVKTMIEAPTFWDYGRGGYLLLFSWCSACRQYHECQMLRHGFDPDVPSFGSQVSGCGPAELLNRGRVTDEILEDLGRYEPRGPQKKAEASA